MERKLRLNILLPIAIAIILPGLSFYSGDESKILAPLKFYERWLSGSLIIYIYWHILWYLSGLKLKFPYLWIVLGAVSFISLMGAILYQLEFGFEWTNIVRLTFVSFLLLTIQYAVKAQRNISLLLLEKEQMQTENYKVQLKALRNKIDPHFLFNSLNTLRSMVRQGHGHSEKFVMSLSDFYRQVLKHNENTTLQLSEELDVLQSYLFLMKSRNEEAIQVDLKISEMLKDYYIPTLALQIVVENCFKHNSMTSRKPLHLEIFHTEDYYVVVRNNLQPKIGEKEPSGYGLTLLRKRYELMNVAEGLIIEQSPSQFTVKLKLIYA